MSAQLRGSNLRTLKIVAVLVDKLNAQHQNRLEVIVYERGKALETGHYTSALLAGGSGRVQLLRDRYRTDQIAAAL